MLIYSDKLEKYIKKNILPNILLVKGNYTTRHEDPKEIYVTDIDIAQVVYPKINPTNIYDAIVELIKRIKSENGIFITEIKCGTDDRFKLESISKESIRKIRSLITEKEQEQFTYIIKKYQVDPKKQLLHATQFLEPFYQLEWNAKEIIKNQKKLRGGTKIKFEEVLNRNPFVVIEYLVKIKNHLIGFDTVIIYQPYDREIADVLEILYQLRLSIPSKKHYYLLYLLKYYYQNAGNRTITNEIGHILEKTLGLYKQLIFTIDNYKWLQKNNLLDIGTAKDTVINVLNDLEYIPDFKSNISNKLRDVAINNTLKTKMREWGILLEVLDSELGLNMDSIAKGYFDNYLKLMPMNKRKDFYQSINQLHWDLTK